MTQAQLSFLIDSLKEGRSHHQYCETALARNPYRHDSLSREAESFTPDEGDVLRLRALGVVWLPDNQ
jgi:hypothetical protein